MGVRLILAVISTLLEEAAIVAIVRWALPQVGVHIPLAGLIALMAVWAAYSVVVYRIGSQALRRKPVISVPDMVGSKAKVVSSLVPEGLVRIKSELWVAKSASGEIEPGGEVIVVEQDGLKLVVRGSDPADGIEKAE
ncbi:NfeD family protein [Chloroflexota bacterium]